MAISLTIRIIGEYLRHLRNNPSSQKLEHNRRHEV
jgi:hypothetical protein